VEGRRPAAAASGCKWAVARSFGDDTTAAVYRAAPPRHNIQRLEVNPVNGKLYLAEADSGPTGKASNSWLEIDPDTAKIREIRLPFNAMEGRSTWTAGSTSATPTTSPATTWPPGARSLDYGEENERLGDDGSIHGHSTKATSALKLIATSPVCYHQGGIYVSPNGSVIASCAWRYVGISSGHLAGKDVHESRSTSRGCTPDAWLTPPRRASTCGTSTAG